MANILLSNNIAMGYKLLSILPPALIGKNFICEFFSCVKDCIADMATFTALSLEKYKDTRSWAWWKVYPMKIFSYIIIEVPDGKVSK